MSSYAMLRLASMVLRLWFVDISFLVTVHHRIGFSGCSWMGTWIPARRAAPSRRSTPPPDSRPMSRAGGCAGSNQPELVLSCGRRTRREENKRADLRGRSASARSSCARDRRSGCGAGAALATIAVGGAYARPGPEVGRGLPGMSPFPLRLAGAHLPRGRPRLVGLGHCNGGRPEVRPLDALRGAGRALRFLRRGGDGPRRGELGGARPRAALASVGFRAWGSHARLLQKAWRVRSLWTGVRGQRGLS